VIELGALDPATLEPADRVLASIPASAWEGLTRGDRIVLTASSLVVADRGSLGLTTLRVYPRSAWESFARDASLALAARSPAALCVRPASPDLCWEPRSAADRHRPALLLGTSASAALVVGASLALGFAYVGERRRLHADRIHVLRTLTHELRTPATSLRLDIEPLRAAYDDLPVSCQEPLLRISDGIERLHRVLHRSARYMALFEDKTSGVSLLNIRAIPSTRELFDELSEEWPEGVTMTGSANDRAVKTDPEWLSVAVRNLVENGTRHGKPPVSVTWSIDESDLVIRVADTGTSSKLSLRRAVAPHKRDENSPGLGLGLAIVDRVARLLGGRLSHEPDPTTFELRVPIDGELS
jgi:signal transduction histidine kinase